MSGKKKYYVPDHAVGNKALASDDKHSILFWLLAGITLLILIWAPFQRALFNGNNFDFERSIFSTFVWSAIMLLLISILAFYKWNLNRWSDFLSIMIWLIPITYFISSISPASKYSATNMVFITFVYASFYLVGFFLAKQDSGSSLLINGIMGSGYLVVWFGIMNWFGHKETAYAIVKWFASDMAQYNIYQHAIMADDNGVRLTSVFQYGNAYAAFLIAMLLGSLYLISISKKWTSTVFHGFMVIPILISFFLTLSRGALVILPVIFLVVIIFLKVKKQLTFILYTIVASIITMAILSPVTNVGVEQVKQYNGALAMKGWTTLIIAALLFTGIAAVLQRFVVPRVEEKLNAISNKKVSYFIIPAGTVVLGAIVAFLLLGNTGFLNLFPENIKQRIENINFEQNSVLERGTFYKDALKLYSDYPVVGAGGGAWSALYEKYQNNPYVSRQAHNFFLQYLVEVGIIGFVIFIVILLSILWLFHRKFHNDSGENSSSRYVYYILAISLLIHSTLDFDLSFVYLGILLFLCLGAMIANNDFEIKGQWKNSIQKAKWAYPALLVVLSIIFFFNGVQLLNANSNFENARMQASISKNFNDITGPLDKAMSQNPNHPDYALFKIDILLQVYNQTKDENYFNEANRILTEMLKKEPHNRTLIDRELTTLTLKGKNKESLERTNQEINNFPWDISLYEKSIVLSTDLGNTAQDKNDAQEMKMYHDQALSIYSKVEARIKELSLLPKGQLQGREFSVTPIMGMALGQIQYIRGHYDAAEAMLRIGVNESIDNQTTRLIIRWYLASLQKQGKADQALFDKLVAKDPNERQEIQNLVNAKF
ncbi:O-antigen ligase family protein [Paenibacillus sp. A3]|uniref:O-antigen ligase family protein n=1 Tax=Paenibacillus sp. A3 TaxID=1337054 RepID=UPI0006D54A65|nr:O-antigen ligase family protein [Paenibacillus sp. A3]